MKSLRYDILTFHASTVCRATFNDVTFNAVTFSSSTFTNIIGNRASGAKTF
jgi:hypothetical protein